MYAKTSAINVRPNGTVEGSKCPWPPGAEGLNHVLNCHGFGMYSSKHLRRSQSISHIDFVGGRKKYPVEKGVKGLQTNMFARVVSLFFITMNYTSRSKSQEALGFNWNLNLRFRKIPLNKLREEWKSGGRCLALLALRDPSSNRIKTIRFQMEHLNVCKKLCSNVRPHGTAEGSKCSWPPGAEGLNGVLNCEGFGMYSSMRL
ncbi:hypothetical protein AVEN_229794-1 [Araneus ventricosus]|uniref:Uncharacterized protein n=1 Tax=Araneus ventricosus TaxID=182803 RepID=A0A4Y2X5D3_ARAVE|nr:hypothetical protein AVEN_229794-1 [Araneus ventricosus]